MSLEPPVRQKLEEALGDAHSWFDIYSNLRASVPEGEELRYRGLIWAFAYDLTSPTEVERREREGSPFGAMFEFEDGRLPPRLADVPDDEVKVWAEAFDAIEDPKSQSRLGDLLWERRYGPRSDLRARAACVALLDLAEHGQWEAMEGTEALERALELALSVSDETLRDRAIHQMVKTIRDELSSEDDRPGIPFTLLRPLADLPSAIRPAPLSDLLQGCEEKYGDDPFHIDTAIDLRAKITDADTEDLRRRQIAAWKAAALRVDGLTRLSHLQHALELARVHGLSNEADQIRRELDSISEEDLDLKTVSAEVKVPREQLEQFINWFLESDDWRECLARFGAHGPPGGELDAQRERVQKQKEAFPIQFLARKIVLDPDSGTTIFEAVDDDAHEIAALAEHRLMAIRLWATFAVEILKRLEEKYGRPSHSDLRDFLISEYIDEALADRLARAFEFWWDGASDESAHLVAPRLEAIVRGIARRLGVPIIREPIGERPGGVRSLGVLLQGLQGHLATEGWHAYVAALLADPLGPNLRNVVAHGLRPAIAVEDAALLLHAACFFRLLNPPTASEAESPKEDA